MTTTRKAVRGAARVVVITPVLLTAVLVLAVLGGQVRTVTLLSGSMGEAMPQGALVLERPVAGHDVAVGDVLTFRPPGYDRPVTHRVVELTSQDGRPYALTRGDANNFVDGWRIPLDQDQLWIARGHIGGQYDMGEHLYENRIYLGVLLPLGMLALAGRARVRERRAELLDTTGTGTPALSGGAR